MLLTPGSWVESSGAAEPEIVLPVGDVTQGVVRIGATVRRPRQASAGFQPPPGVPFFRDTMPDPPELARLIDAPSIVGHNDVTPQNVIIRGGVPVGLVDFDLAWPTTPAREVANTALHWAPICDPGDRPSALAESHSFLRTRLIADGFRLGAAERAVLADVLLRGAQVGWHRMHAHAIQLGGGWPRMWDEGVGDVIRRQEQWLVRTERR